MTDNLDSNTFKIISLAEGNPPVGIGFNKLLGQNVHANAPVQSWRFHKVGEGRYKLSIGGYSFTGVLDGKVFVSLNPMNETEWKIIQHEYQNAYSIILADNPSTGWTVPSEEDGSSAVEIAPIITTHSLPPRYLPRQSFLLDKQD